MLRTYIPPSRRAESRHDCFAGSSARGAWALPTLISGKTRLVEFHGRRIISMSWTRPTAILGDCNTQTGRRLGVGCFLSKAFDGACVVSDC